MMDWFPAVMALVGVLVGLGVQEFRIWREKKDKYKDMVFEKRLDAHQGAYYWCTRLLKVSLPHNLMEDGGVQAAMDVIDTAAEWTAKNALYLDEDSRAKMDDLFIFVNIKASKYLDGKAVGGINSEEEKRKVIKKVREVLYSIRKGIGVQYLPERKI